jgi:hypothetical protein
MGAVRADRIDIERSKIRVARAPFWRNERHGFVCVPNAICLPSGDHAGSSTHPM